MKTAPHPRRPTTHTPKTMSFRRRLRGKKLPAGFDKIEDVIEDFEAQMKDAVNEDHAGKLRTELSWKVHRVHWEKNRFIYDLMYKRKVMSRELVRELGWLFRGVWRGEKLETF